MDSYHGTDHIGAKNIVAGKIKVYRGGGELGRGFYSGKYLCMAKTWANHKYHDSESVVKICVDDALLKTLNIKHLGYNDACRLRKNIKKKRRTRKYTRGVDMLSSPIVGTKFKLQDWVSIMLENLINWSFAKFNNEVTQYKWESIKAEYLINGSSTKRQII